MKKNLNLLKDLMKDMKQILDQINLALFFQEKKDPKINVPHWFKGNAKFHL